MMSSRASPLARPGTQGFSKVGWVPTLQNHARMIFPAGMTSAEAAVKMRFLLSGIFVCCVLAAAPVRADDITTGVEYFAESAGNKIRIWEKVAGTADGKPVIVLAHGSGTAGQGSFDLQVPDETDTSLMDVLARDGFDVFAPDMRGFGLSTHPETGVTTVEAAEDLNAAVDVIRALRHTDKVHVVAWSWGTQYAGLFVIAHPEKVSRFVSYAQMHANSPDILKRRERLEEFRKGPYMDVPEAAWKKRFSSMTPETANGQDVIDAFAREAARVETRSPTGPHIDMVTKLPMLDAGKITVPTLMIHGQYDDVADPPGLMPFFAALSCPEKSYAVIPNAGHMAHLQEGRSLLQSEIASFLRR